MLEKVRDELNQSKFGNWGYRGERVVWIKALREKVLILRITRRDKKKETEEQGDTGAI